MLFEDKSRFALDGGFTASVADFGVPLMLADNVTVVTAATAAVLMVKVALKLPAGTVTLGGTEALGSLLDKGTDNPPDGAAFARVTVPCAELPPMTDVGT